MSRGKMVRAGELFGSMLELRKIKPPVDRDPITGRVYGGSYTRWQRFLDEAIPCAAFSSEDEYSPVGLALALRRKWLRDCIANGVPFEESEALFSALFETQNRALEEGEQIRLDALQRARSERDGKRRDTKGDDLLRYATETLG